MAKTSSHSKAKSEPASSTTEPSTSTTAETSDSQVQDDDVYQAEAVMDKKITKGKLLYLVKWHGYPRSQSTWEPLENLVGCESFIEKFETGGKTKVDKRKALSAKKAKKPKKAFGKSAAKKEASKPEDEDEEEDDTAGSASVDESLDSTKIGNPEVKEKAGEGANDGAANKSAVSNEGSDKADPKGSVSPVEVSAENVQSQPGNPTPSTSDGANQGPSASLGGPSQSNSLGSVSWGQFSGLVEVPLDAESTRKASDELKKYGAESFKVVGLMTHPESAVTSVVMHCVKPSENQNWIKAYPFEVVKRSFPEKLRGFYDGVTKSIEVLAAAADL
ncbi:hypothetical protein RvY_07740 [Ramazzottius varieornatus]|uniref:Chromo domain-containing protein n=1 Tax=Ramazzottius varieornatus TaxID=947166 RepID=A0A1D1V3J8_RAMVA|nr:hypothetical protein RvY_07740 [Ramazzottius varieornatus]